MTFYRDREMTRCYGENARSVGLSFDRRLQVSRYADVFRHLCGEAAVAGAAETTPRADEHVAAGKRA
jgi:hypothetical protein